VLFVPPSHPPSPLRGCLVSCFLTPDDAEQVTYPAMLRGELEARFGRYVPDVPIHGRSRDELLSALLRMTSQHFAIARHVWSSREPDFLMMVEIGPDRLHHAFFGGDEPESERACAAYYAALDRELSSLVSLADEDTSVLIASDHGARPLRSVFRINEWLLQQDYLALREGYVPPSATALSPEMIDFSRTTAWAEGGYYARVMLNVSGREPHGIVAPERYEAERARLRQGLEAVAGPSSPPWQNRVETPETLYREVRGFPPDLLAIFDDLSVRPVATVGTGALYAERDDLRSDRANHDFQGIFVLSGAGVSARGRLAPCQIHDVGATVLALFGVPKPDGFLGVDRSV
jgi:predicted AlkP superfamily phosphohydrolase/phosphomutase